LTFDRASEADRLGWYEMITDLMASMPSGTKIESRRPVDQVLSDNSTVNLTLYDAYIKLAHRKEDLIVR